MEIRRSDPDNLCCTPPAVHRPTRDIQVMSTTESSKPPRAQQTAKKLNSCQPPQSTASPTEHRHTCHEGRVRHTIKRHPSCVEVSAHQRTHEGGKGETGQRGRLIQTTEIKVESQDFVGHPCIEKVGFNTDFTFHHFLQKRNSKLEAVFGQSKRNSTYLSWERRVFAC